MALGARVEDLRAPTDGALRLRSQLLPAFVRRARQLGVAVDDLLIRNGIPVRADAVADVCVSARALRDVCEAIARRAHDPAYGFHTALEMPRGAYGILEYVARNAPTLGAVAEQLARFSRLINAQLEVRFDPATGIVEQRLLGEPECLGKQGNEFSLTHQLKIARDALGAPLVPRRVFFAHRRVGDDRELVCFFGTRAIEYGATCNGFEVSSDALAAPVAASDPLLLRLLEERARQLVSELSIEDDLEPVRRAIAEQLETGDPTAKRVARDLGTSERTLHRRLLSRGQSFRKIVEELRHRLALRYLSDASTSMTDVAVRLGYSDGRAFARAFRRWTRTSPGAWRSANR